MLKLKKVVCVLSLTFLLVGLMLVNGTQLLGEVSNSQIGDPQVLSAEVGRLPRIEIKKAWYGDNGEFLGCYSSGNNCIVIVLATTSVHVAAGGVLLR